MTAGTISFTRGEDPLRADKLNAALAERLLRAGDNMLGPLILFRDPQSPFEAATRQYVDARIIVGGGGGAGIPDAPLDANVYGRGGASWQPVLRLTGGILSGPLTLAGNASSALQPVTLQQLNAGFLPLTGGTVGGDVTVNGTFSVGLGKAITTSGTVLSGHFAAGRSGDALGGFVGSWNVATSAYTGFYTDASGNIIFGSADAATGVPTTTRGTLAPNGTLTLPGGLTINAAAIINGPAGSNRQLALMTANSGRWIIGTDAVAESGGNAGTNFIVGRFSDAGAYIDAPLTINRTTGAVTTTGTISAGAGSAITTTGTMLGGHLVASQPSPGMVGSWDQTSNKYVGLLLDASSTYGDIMFGAGNAGTGGFNTWFGAISYTGINIGGATATKPGGGSWTAPSDDRIKQDVEPYTSSLAEVLQLKPIRYRYNGKGGTVDDGNTYVGLSAQATQPIMPELVVLTPLPPNEFRSPGLENQLGTDLGPLMLALVNAMQEVSARLDTLEGARV